MNVPDKAAKIKRSSLRKSNPEFFILASQTKTEIVISPLFSVCLFNGVLLEKNG